MWGYFSFKKDLKIDKKLKISKIKNPITFTNGKICFEQKGKDLRDIKIVLFGTITEIYSKQDTKNTEKQIYNLYKKHGNDFPLYLDGQFLIVLYDERKSIFKIFNNRYESANLYYYLDKDVFVFAQDLKDLLTKLSFKPEFNYKSLPTFLDTGFSSTEYTQFKNVFRLLPTFYITLEKNKFKLDNYWKKDFKFNRKSFKNLDKQLDQYEILFQNSIKTYLNCVKTKKLGIFLSGGHDTTYVYLQASKIFKKPIHTFTASFENWGFDESPKAKAITKMRKGIHHRVVISSKHLDLIPEMVRALEQPLSGSPLPAYVLAKETAKYVDTVFTGDPGDTLWGEYYPVAEWHKYLRYLPLFAKKTIYSTNRIFLNITDWERLWELEHVFHLFSKKNTYKDFMQKLCSYRHFRNTELTKLLNNKYFKKIEKNTCSLEIPFTKDNFHDALIEAKMFYGVYVYNVPMNQKPIERFGLNFYTPYLNKKVIDFINSLPEEWINSGNTFQKLTNYAVRRKFHKMALLRYLPKRFVYSLQQSFDVPWHVLFNKRPGILKNLLKRLKKRGWYNTKELEKIFIEFPKQKAKPHEILELKHHGYRIYSLLVFEVWCMEFLDNVKPQKMTIPLEKYLAT